MSRGIKFRVWSEDQKTYNYKFPYNSRGDFYVNTRGKVFSDFGNSVAPEVRQEAFIVEQSTGLKDKNGKEIYEGDIVDYCGECTCVIQYADECARFIHRDISDDFPFGFDGLGEYKGELFEVIGNIHENPELLEDKNGKN